MLNQHSYSQSEPQHHIAARLSADENGTLGPDSKNVQGLLTRELCVCVCVRIRERERLCLEGRDASHFTFQAKSKTEASAPFCAHPPTSMTVKAI